MRLERRTPDPSRRGWASVRPCASAQFGKNVAGMLPYQKTSFASPPDSIMPFT
jgi:hypothetical protein